MIGKSNIVGVASGKGGVGKTWLSITLAQTAAKRGQKALVLDGDLGLANIDVQLGLAPTRDLSLWASGAAPLAGLIQSTPAGFDLIPGASGQGGMSSLAATEIARLGGEFAALAAGYDLALIDISAGVDATQIRLAAAAGRCLLVITEDPTSLTDGYAFVKLARRLKRPPAFDVAVNMAESDASGRRAYAALARACKSFLGMEPPLAGVVRRDPSVVAAIRRQTALLDMKPTTPAAMDVAALLDAVLKARAQAA